MQAGDQKQVILLEVYVLVLFTFLWFVPYQFNKHYRSVPGKHPWALYHNSQFFTTLGAYPVYWALAM